MHRKTQSKHAAAHRDVTTQQKTAVQVKPIAFNQYFCKYCSLLVPFWNQGSDNFLYNVTLVLCVSLRVCLGEFLYSNTDRRVVHMTYTCDRTRKFHFSLSQHVDACLNIPLRVHFCVGVLGSFLFPFCINCAEGIMGVFSGLNLGPSEGGHSRFGQQTGCERFHDGGGDLPVSHTQHHHNTLMARTRLLRTDRRRVS